MVFVGLHELTPTMYRRALKNTRQTSYIFFTNLPCLGDSEGTFQSSSQAATCPPNLQESCTYPTRLGYIDLAVIAVWTRLFAKSSSIGKWLNEELPQAPADNWR